MQLNAPRIIRIRRRTRMSLSPREHIDQLCGPPPTLPCSGAEIDPGWWLVSCRRTCVPSSPPGPAHELANAGRARDQRHSLPARIDVKCTGLVFTSDPITATGNAANSPAATTATLNPLRTSVPLAGLTPPGLQSGAYWELRSDFRLRTRNRRAAYGTARSRFRL